MGSKLNITKDTHFMTSGLEVVSMPRQVKITNRMSGSTYDEAKANAQLLADALETANTSGKLPSELLKERDRLIFATKNAISYLESFKQEWEEGEELLHAELTQSIKG